MSGRHWILISVLALAGLAAWSWLDRRDHAGTGPAFPEEDLDPAAEYPEALEVRTQPGPEGRMEIPGAEPGDRAEGAGGSSSGDRREWWRDPDLVARLREIYLPDFQQRLQKLAEERSTDASTLTLGEQFLGKRLGQALGNEEEYGLIDSRLVRGNFPALVGDLALWLSRTLGRQRRNIRWSDKVGSRAFPEEEYERTPWEFPPDVHLDRISPDGAWRGDPELLEELTLYQVEYLNRIVPILGERQELLSAVSIAAVRQGLSQAFLPWEMEEFIPEAAEQRARLDAALEAFRLQAAEARRRRGLAVRED